MSKTKFLTLRASQEKAYLAMVGKHRTIGNMPTGWGKSMLLCALAATDLLNRRKVIICVPQRIIAKGFVQEKQLQLPNGPVVNWSLPNNLCDPTPEKVAQLLDFLSSPAIGTVLTTHITLSYAFQKLADDEVAQAFRNTTLIVDESHHVHTSEQGRNSLGQVIGTILDLNDPTTKLILATAFFFRGDHLPIISESHLARCHRYAVPFDEYWASLKHIKTYSYDFVAYKGTVFGEVEKVLKASQVPTIIYCPPEGHRMLLGKSKTRFVTRLRRLCEQAYGAEQWEPGCSAKGRYVVDFVDTDNRTEKIHFVAQHGESVAAILTVGMFREGADWVEAARILDLVPTGSDQDRLQRFGRLIRDCPDKQHVSYYSFFPLDLDQPEDERRRELSKLYAHFHASLILENAVKPVRVKVKTEASDEQGKPRTHTDCLGSYDQQTQEAILRQAFDELIKLQDEKAKQGLSVGPDDARSIVVGVLKENGITKELEATARQVILIMRRRANISLDTDSLVDAGFDKVWATDVFDGLIAYSAGIGGPSTLAEIRKVIGCVFSNQWQETYDKVKGLFGPPSTQSSAYWWCTHNKVLHQQGKLDSKKVKLLEAIGWWTWVQGIQDRWQENFDKMSGLASAPKAGTREYDWVSHQKKQHSKGKLEPYKVALLDGIGWWTWQRRQDLWQTMATKVAQCETRPIRDSKEDSWLRENRKYYKQGKLTPEQVATLGTIRWWKIDRLMDRWLENASKIAKCEAPPKQGSKEYQWIRSQRKAHREGRLTGEQLATLDTISWF